MYKYYTITCKGRAISEVVEFSDGQVVVKEKFGPRRLMIFSSIASLKSHYLKYQDKHHIMSFDLKATPSNPPY